MRKLKTADVFGAIRLIKASGTKNEFTKTAMMARENPDFSVEKIGADLIFGIIEGLANVGADKAFYDFLAGPLEMNAQDIAEMDLINLVELLKSYKDIEDKEAWAAFFDSVAKLMR